MSWIIFDPLVCGGRPVIRGTRVTVESVQGRIRGGDPLSDLLEERPDICIEAFQEAMDFDLSFSPDEKPT